MQPYFIGLDSGTSGIKAVLFDEAGREVAARSYPLTPICPVETWFEENPLEIWDKACRCIAEVVRAAPGGIVIGIGVTAQGDGLWMIDGNGDPVRNGCCFCDGRAGEQLERWTRDGTVERVFSLCGTRLFTGNQSCIVKWMEENEPESLARAQYFMHLKDYLFYKLTGVVSSDATDQSLVFLDLRTRRYDDRLFELYGLERYREKYPPLPDGADSGAIILGELADALGLSHTVLVTSGPMDVAACALGAGVTEPGQCCSIIGTAALHEMVIGEPCADSILAGMTVSHAMHGRNLRLMASLAGTPNLEWLLGVFGSDLRREAMAKGVELYAYLTELAGGVPAGADGVLYHPYLLAGGERAPFTDPNARASITGISANTGAAQMVRACFEGVAYAMMDCYAHMPSMPTQVTLCGGGAKSPFWCQMFADALGVRTVKVKGDELGARGAVIHNAVTQGVYGDHEAAVRHLIHADAAYEPDAAQHREYERYFELYRRTRELMAESWKLRHGILRENG